MWMEICTLKPTTRVFLHFTETDHNDRVNLETENSKLTSLEMFL